MTKIASIELMKRYLLFIIGLTILAFGVAFSIKAELGTSPISSLPYATSLFIPLTVGNLTIIMHCLFILLQLLFLRRKYQIIQLLQLPVAFAFGYLTDFAIWTTNSIMPSAYWQQWLICIVGILLVALGVSCEVTANVVTLAGEGLVLAICKVSPIKFCYMKVIFDVTLVISSGILSFLFIHHLAGIGAGTVVAAVFVGLIAKQFNRLLLPLNKKLCQRKNQPLNYPSPLPINR